MSPALAGRFFATEPPGKTCPSFLICLLCPTMLLPCSWAGKWSSAIMVFVLCSSSRRNRCQYLLRAGLWEGVSGSSGHPRSSLWALESQRTNKQRHHWRKALTCPRRVSQKPWEDISNSLPPSMSCASGGLWYSLISFQNHSCKGFWDFFFFF